MTEVTVQGDVLEWALEDSGVNRNEILESAGLGELAERSLHLTGPISISEEDLKGIAKATRRSIYFFALPEPPATSRHAVDANFRAPMSNSGELQDLNSDERAAVREAKRRQLAAAKISMRLERKRIELPTIPQSATPEKAADIVTQWLQWEDISTRRKKINSKNKLFIAIRNALEDQGIMTNLLPLGENSLRGFTLHHDYAPLIFVNSSIKYPQARSFTLLHELGHLLRGVDKACGKHDLQSRTTEESWCNRFAAVFLMPEEELYTYMDKHLKEKFVQNDDIESVRRIAQYFFCSYFSVAIRLKQLGRANSRLVEEVSNFNEPVQSGYRPGGQKRAEKRISAYGTGIARLYDEALQETDLSEIAVRKSLNLRSHQELQDFRFLGREAS